MTGLGHRRTAILKGYAPVRIRTAREAYEHSERRFSRLQGFSFTTDDAPGMVSSGPRHAGWSLALVKSTGHRIALGDDDKVSLLFPYRGVIAVQRRGAESEARPDELLIVAPGQRTTVLSSDYLGVLIQIPIDVFEASLGRDGVREGRVRRALAHLHAGHAAALAAYDAVRVLEATQPSLQSPQAWRALVDPILAAAAGPGEEDGAAALPRALAHVRAAEAFMAANLHRRLSVADIARACGVGARALQGAFRRLRRRSPLEVLNDMRVREASRRLAAAGHPPSVTEVALDCGFTHLGRFSATYRAARGERPSTTARQSRLRVGRMAGSAE
jgi:AraC-like DNA-binding protein